MIGCDEPVAFDRRDIREVLGRPGILEDISIAVRLAGEDGRRLAGDLRSPALGTG